MLVNNAGIVRFGAIVETEPPAWRQVIDINLTGTYLGIRAIVPSMRKAGGGAIVNYSLPSPCSCRRRLHGGGLFLLRDQFGLGCFVGRLFGQPQFF